jgi:prevent-host-death family protein
MLQTWQLQEAKNKLSRVIEDAIHRGPQIITRRGTEVAIVISMDEYREMMAHKGTLIEFFRRSPLVGVDLDLNRDKSSIRPNVEL